MRWILQLFITLLIVVVIKDNLLKSIVLLGFWIPTFFRYINRKEFIFVFVCNLIFIISNLGALKNNVFHFRDQDVLLMPWNELMMWGFYILNTRKFAGELKVGDTSSLSLYVLVSIFAMSFSFIRNEWILFFIGLTIFLWALFLLRKLERVLKYISYYAFIGFLVELYGVHFGFWNYPHARYFSWPLWGPFMWLNIGWITAYLGARFIDEKDTRIPVRGP